MTETVATTAGLFPVPDWAKLELADLKGHQKSDLVSGDESPDVAAAYERARREVLEYQQSAGLDRVVEGQLRWDDMLAHPLAVHPNVETRGIVRYYNNNNFYREPVVTGELTFSGDVAGELEAAVDLRSGDGTAGLQAVLPGPYSLSDLATDEHYGDDETLLAEVADFLAAEVAAFPAHETLFLLEPSLVMTPPGRERDLDARASQAIDAVAAETDADVVVHTYWGALDERVYAHLLDAAVSAVGVDLVTDHEATRYNLQEYGATDDISLGVVDGQNTRVEEATTVRDRVEWIREGLPTQSFDTIYATPNTGLFYLPVNKFEAKLDVLAAAAEPEEVTA